MLKFKIKKGDLSKLSAELQALYTLDGDEATLNPIEGLDTADELRTAKKNEVDAHKATKALLKTATEEKTGLETQLATFQDLAKSNVPKANLDALEKSYAEKFTKLEGEKKTEVEKLTGSLNTLLVDNVAGTLANKISTSPGLILPIIKARLKAEIGSDGKPVTKVLDGAGMPSALTMEDFEKEIIGNKEYSAIIKAGQGSGGGAPGSGDKGGARKSTLDYSKATPAEIAKDLEARGVVPAAGAV